MALEGGHNGKRDIDWLTLVITIIFDCFGLDIANLQVSECRALQSVLFHFSNLKSMAGDDSQASPSSTEIAQALNNFQQNFQKNQDTKGSSTSKNSPNPISSTEKPLPSKVPPKKENSRSQKKNDKMKEVFDDDDHADAEDESIGTSDDNFFGFEDSKGDVSSIENVTLVNSQPKIRKQDDKNLGNEET